METGRNRAIRCGIRQVQGSETSEPSSCQPAASSQQPAQSATPLEKVYVRVAHPPKTGCTTHGRTATNPGDFRSVVDDNFDALGEAARIGSSVERHITLTCLRICWNTQQGNMCPPRRRQGPPCSGCRRSIHSQQGLVPCHWLRGCPFERFQPQLAASAMYLKHRVLRVPSFDPLPNAAGATVSGIGIGSG